jgi:single-strand DNA-binding protein|tara:strand:- start:6693 stop:7070 length:378 start_codon:yes stop_codon:yes gene_type:complete
MNKHFITGNVGNDPEIKKLDSGMTIAKMSIAVNEFKKDKDTGQREKSTTWFNIVAFGKLAELVQAYVKKGKKILVIGKVSIREYIGEDGVKRYFTETIADEIEFLSTAKEDNQIHQDHDEDDLPF